MDPFAWQHPGMWVFYTRDFNQSKVVIIFKPGIKVIVLHDQVQNNPLWIKYKQCSLFTYIIGLCSIHVYCLKNTNAHKQAPYAPKLSVSPSHEKHPYAVDTNRHARSSKSISIRSIYVPRKLPILLSDSR